MAKTQGINFIERHIEKIVLGVVGLVFVFVLATQFVGSKTTVKINNQELDPESAVDEIAQQARLLRAQVEEENPELPAAPVLGLEEEWARLRSSADDRVLAVSPLVRPQGPAATADRVDEADVPVTGDYKYPELAVHAPSKPLTVSFWTTLDPFEVASNPELREIVGPKQPFDIPAVSIESTFDARKLRETLAMDPDGEGSAFSPIPIQWWRDNVEILEVQVERADAIDEQGNPVNLVRVGNLPGRKSLRELVDLPEPLTAEALDELVGYAREEAKRVREPAFYRSIAGRPWMAPSDFAKLDEIEAQKAEIQRLVRQYRSIEEDLERTRQQLADARQGGPGAPGRIDDFAGDPMQRNRRPTRDPGRQQEDPRIKRLNDTIDRLLLDQDRVKLQLEDMGVDETGEPIVGQEDDESEFADPLLESDEVRLLAHDVRVEQGRRYIYRTRVVVNNPLFGHGQQLHEDQRSLASSPTVASEWSEWSEPVEVLRDRYYFVTAASVGDMIGGPRANVEVYQFWYGYWRKGSSALEPGDAITAELRLPDPELLPIFDMEQLSSQVQIRQNDPDRNRRDRRRMLDDPGAFGMPPPPRRGQDDDDAELPPGARPADPLPPVQIQAVLLDVGTMPGGDENLTRAIFRGVVGALTPRIPRLDVSSALYERIKESAEEGLRQGRPEPEPEPEPDPIVRPPQRDRPPPSRDQQQAPGGG